MAGLRRRQRVEPEPLPLPGMGAAEAAEPDGPGPPSPGLARPSFEVRVIRSAKRTRTSSARLVGTTLEVRLPAWMSAAEEARWVAEWTRRFERRVATDRIDLPGRADTLARRYHLPRPSSIHWVTDMRTRWGSCTPATGAVRLSSTLAGFPDWVVDYVIIHELAHLREAGHSAAFWQLVERYPKSERARGYLMAKGGDEDAW